MKIQTDSTWCKIMDEKGKILIDYGLRYGAHDFCDLTQKIFNKTQLIRLIDHDGTYTLSKKAEKILLEEIKRITEEKQKVK